MDVEDIEGARAVDPIEPVDLVEPPRQEVHAPVVALIGTIGAVPVEPPAAEDRTKAHCYRTPRFKIRGFGLIEIGDLVISRRLRMNVAVGAVPYLRLVVHVIEMAGSDGGIGDRASSGGESCRESG